jgi:hypothetical protein
MNMETTADSPTLSLPKTSTARLWLGRVLTGIPALFLVWGATFQLTKHPQAIEGAKQMGFDPSTLTPLAIIQLLAVALLTTRRTAAFGALVITGYLGGAVSIHVRQGDPLSAVLLPVVFATVIWLGLFLRDERVRAVSPFAR